MIYAKTGMKGHNVQSWQMSMNKVRGTTKNPMLAEDGIFGPATLKATINTQRVIGVKADGIVGDGTYEAFRKKFPMVAVGFISPYTPPAEKAVFDKQALEAGKANKAILTQQKIFPTSTKIKQIVPPLPKIKKQTNPVIPIGILTAVGYYFVNKA